MMIFIGFMAMGYFGGLFFSLSTERFQAWWQRKFGKPAVNITLDYPAQVAFIFSAVYWLRAFWHPNLIKNAFALLLLSIGALLASHTIQSLRKHK